MCSGRGSTVGAPGAVRSCAERRVVDLEDHRDPRARSWIYGSPLRCSSSPVITPKLCGASPISASSGTTQRHRLNWGGHRQAYSALYRSVIVRMRFHPPTIAYVQRRTAEGKSKREIIRCLKRYLAREIYRHIAEIHARHHARTRPQHATPNSLLTTIGATTPSPRASSRPSRRSSSTDSHGRPDAISAPPSSSTSRASTTANEDTPRSATSHPRNTSRRKPRPPTMPSD